MSFPQLEQLSSRSLNLVGSLFSSGHEVRVVLSSRAVNPATVVLESRTVVLDPRRTGLFDLAICARLLEHRPLRKTVPRHERDLDSWLTRKTQRQLADAARKQLLQEYPASARLPGRYNAHGRDWDGLSMVVNSVKWSDLSADAIPYGTDSLSQVIIPELEIHGADDDFQWLERSLADGKIPLETIPGLTELPFVSVPFRVCQSEAGSPTQELFEHQMSNEKVKEIVQKLVNCYRRKSEVRDERITQGSHSVQGVRLDTNRLIEAVLGSRVGLEPKLFRRKAGLIEPVFDPRQHLVVVELDLNDLWCDCGWYSRARAELQRFVCCVLRAQEILEVDCLIHAFADRLITLANGQVICLHWTTTVKSLDQPFDPVFWKRLASLFDHTPQLPGTSGCFHPLSLEDARRGFGDTARELDHSYRALIWWARHGMPDDFPSLQSHSFLTRSADYIDREVQELRTRYGGTFDTQASYLPHELKQHSRPGGYLRSVRF